ncbi:MAG TPA: PQQ-binding-like beta-propeller repeat protein, partial [Chloroflexia bacterium]|nr:PQQ-binding-like beta-propeller repeat protein [Chloroflexia bacterium]
NTNVLFFTSQDGYVNALRANDGSSFWAGGGRKIGDSVVAGVAYQPNVPVLITGTTSLIFAGTFHDTTPPNNQFVALNALTGAPVWNFGGTLTATMGLLPTSPAAHWQSNTVFFGTKAPTTGSGVGAVWAVDTTTGLAKWVNTSIGSVVNSAPSLSQDGQTLYIGTVNGSTFTLYALRTIDGTVRASFTAPGGVGDFRGAPWVWPNATNMADSDVYATAGDRIYAFTDTNATTGTLPFKSGWATGFAPVPGASTPILVPSPFVPAPGALYASGNDATVYKINLADGTISSTTVLGSSMAAVSELSFDRLRNAFYLTYNGAIYSLNLSW